MITIQAERPYIQIDGTRYIVEHRVAKLAELLVHGQGKTVERGRMMAKIGASSASVHVYITELRAIMRQHGYELQADFGIGYKLIAPAPRA